MSWFKKNNVVYRESDALTNIDGFLVTDGDQVRVTIRARLHPSDKARGKEALLDLFRSNSRPGVYLWNSADGRAYYSGSSHVSL